MPWPPPFLLLGTALLGVVGPLQNGPMKAQNVTTQAGQPTDQRFEQWLDPATGQRVNVRFSGETTTVERGAQVSTYRNAPFDEAAALAEARKNLLPLTEWNIWNVMQWRTQLLRSAGSPEEARRRFVSLGLPVTLWDDIDTFSAAVGQSAPADQAGAVYASSLTVTADGTINIDSGTTGSEKIVRPSDPQWQGNLLIHPTPEIRQRYAKMQAEQPISVVPPPASASFDEQTRLLEAAGAVRLSARRPDSSLWLTPALEPYRHKLAASEQPVLRLSADKGRTPKPWESKLGGVPYRLKGAAWPMSREKTPRPLVFLAQLNLADLNPGGAALPGYPSRGLLQFFILNGDFYGADMEHWTDDTGFRVLYLPDVVRDASRLEQAVPAPVGDLDGNLPFDNDLKQTTALRATPDREMVSGADRSAPQLLGLPQNHWDEQVERVVSDLDDLSPGRHKLGGFPDFTQPDPRSPAEHWRLLFQLDSDDALGLTWGDMGTANFFIHPDDLKKRDFSHVAYHWDS